MASVNKAILIGNVGRDPEIRYTTGGQCVANLSIATSDSWTDKQGAKQERTEWHRIVAWGKLAELVKEYVRKGRPLYVEGRIQTRSWQDKDGQTRYTTEIVASTIQFLGARDAQQQSGGASDFAPPAFDEAPAGGASAFAVSDASLDEDVPF